MFVAALSVAGADAQPADEAYINWRFADAGFTPLTEMTFGGRDVRRVLPLDPYGFLPIPGVEMERHQDGHLTLRAQYRGWTGDAYALSQQEWSRLAELQSAAFAPPGENQYKIKPGVVVHCWSGMIQASPARAASWWACNSGTKAAQSYTEAVLELAMQKKGCPASKRDTFGRFSQCFANKGMPDDPTLQEGFLALTEAWKKQREPGADLLSDARKALDAASKGGDAESLLRARRAVLAFGGQQRALRDIVRKGTAFAKDAREASSKDATVIATQLDSWRADITAQETNYVGLLEQLTAISAPATAPAS